MSKLQTFQVFPFIPEPLKFLETLSRNMWWCWRLDAVELFRRISPKLWEESGRNPIVFSTMIPQKRFEDLAKDESFLAHQERVKKAFEDQVMSPVNRFTPKSLYKKDEMVAYFSMEFGIHESLPLFAGGLGVLAGDHLKAASDMAIPLVAVGLLYREGYFHQFLDLEGLQQEEYPEIDLYHLPLVRIRDNSDNLLYVSVNGPDGEIRAAVWKINIGRIPLYLLDTNIPDNPPEIRSINSRLYPADGKIRLAQEVLLGIGGMRVLKALELYPDVCHLNEGHCAFLNLERLAQIMEKNQVNLRTAFEIVPRATLFTTHTPVPAGHDEFPAYLVRPYLIPFQDRLKTSIERILSWGQAPGSGPDGTVSMFVLGMRMAQYCNGVSDLHGNVARRMWAYIWRGIPQDEVPITHITNGIHIPSWISIENTLLFERYLGPDWYLHTWMNEHIINRIDAIYDEELWRAHEMSRSRLIRTCRSLMLKQYARRNASMSMMRDAESVLDQDILTIAFARRFATYKRANLLLKDPERLEAMITSETRPVQFIFAGKAHPRDTEGKKLIQNIIQFAHKRSVRHRIVFLEDYDINIARHLVQGADVWLNTPRRPFEACGTSGMKASVNGVLNVSVLDGWWCEGYSENTGWRIGNGEEYEDYDYQDIVESQALYNVLENDVIPCFYDRKSGDVPLRWLRMMKASMKMVIRHFCSHRMVEKYEKRFYLPAIKRLKELTADASAEANRLTAQHRRLCSLWKNIRIEQPIRDANGPFRVGDSLNVSTLIHLGELRPDEVIVQLYYGHLKSVESLTASHTEDMTVTESRENGMYLYSCKINCSLAGRYGFTVRIIPMGDDWLKFAPGLITWA